MRTDGRTDPLMEEPFVSKRPLHWMAGLALLGVLAGACSNGSTSKTNTKPAPNDGTTGLFPSSQLNKPQHTGTPKRGGTMKFGMESTVLNYSPNNSVIQPSDLELVTSVFDSLITYDSNNEPVLDNTDHKYNQLADTLTADKVDGKVSGKSWTLKLRPGIKFSNGVALTAQQVVDHTNWVIKSGTCSCSADADNIASITAEGDLTVHYQLTKANVAWPTKLANTGLAWITESGARGDAANPQLKQLIGTGAFVYDTAVNGNYTVVKNPNYYGTDAANNGAKLPYLDKIEFQPLADTSTRLSAVQSNGVQIMQTADTSNLVNAKQDANLTVQPVSGSSSTILVLNLNSLPFGVLPKPGETPTETARRGLNDPTAQKARTAFETGINRNEINQKYYKGARVPAYGFIPETSPYYDPKGQLPRYNLAKAKSMVSELKSANPPVKMDVNSICIPGPEATGIFQILQQQGKATGINATLHTVEQSVLVNTLLLGQGTSATKDWNVACFRSPQLSDPDGVYGSLYTTGATNLVKYSRPDTVDKWLDEGRSVVGVSKRKPIYDKIQEQVAKDVVYIPLLFDYYGNIHQDSVSGLGQPQPDSLGLIPLGSLYYKQ